MPTGDSWVNLYPEKIVDLEDLRDAFVDPTRSSLLALALDVFRVDGGIVIGPTAPTVVSAVVSGSGTVKVTAPDPLVAYTPTGARVVPTIDEEIPFADAGATTYTIGAASTEFPEAAELGADGLPRWKRTVEVVGRTINPASVADLGGGSGLRLTCTSTLAAGEKWANDAGTRAVRVVYEDASGNPATHTSEAVFEGDLERASGVFRIDVPHYFGQVGTPSTTAARYRVVLLGITPADPTLAASAAFTDYHVNLGTVAGGGGGAHSAADVNLVDVPAFAEAMADFYAHHNADGSHLDKIAWEDLVAPKPVVATFESSVEDGSDVPTVTFRARRPSGAVYEGTVYFRVHVYHKGGWDHPRPVDLTAASDAMPNIGTVSTGTRLSSDTAMAHIRADGSQDDNHDPRRQIIQSDADGVIAFKVDYQAIGSGTKTFFVEVTPINYGDPDGTTHAYPYVPLGPTVKLISVSYGT